MNELDQGFKLVEQFVSAEIVNTIIADIEAATKQNSTHGMRNAEKKFESIANLVHSEKLLAKAKSILGKHAHLVRVILFDKTPDKNWLVAWHQDRTVSVNKKQHIHGWGPWSLKDAVQHVQPCEAVLNNMVAFRIHLDDTNANNGCLKIIPNSHAGGVLTQVEIDNIVQNAVMMECEAKAGDMLIMRPLVLHASSKAKVPKHRRIIHVEFSGYQLPDGVYWG